MREFIKMFFWGMGAWFFVPVVLLAFVLLVIVGYGIAALTFMAMIIYGVCWLLARNPAEANDFVHAFFYFLTISVVWFGLCVAVHGKIHKLSGALRARTAPIPRYEVYPSDEPFNE